MIRNAENMHYQYEMGLLEEERIRVSSEIIRRLMLRNQHFSRLWTSLESSLREKFVDWMESIFEESKSSRLQG
jgi:coenzyme F420-reducing hydrogenase delta subunit